MNEICKNCNYCIKSQYKDYSIFFYTCFRFPKRESVGENHFCGEFVKKNQKGKDDEIHKV